MIEKIWLVTQESNVDGEILFNVVPCKDFKTAKREFEREIGMILGESHQFGGYTHAEREEMFEVEDDGDGHFYINDPYDDYYEDINIEEKQILY